MKSHSLLLFSIRVSKKIPKLSLRITHYAFKFSNIANFKWHRTVVRAMANHRSSTSNAKLLPSSPNPLLLHPPFPPTKTLLNPSLTQTLAPPKIPALALAPLLNDRNPSLTAIETTPLETRELVVADKLERLVLEFKSLVEPLDRVKRLLHYASNLPPYDESCRVPENRVMGCATQVLLEAEMDKFGRMRFRADSEVMGAHKEALEIIMKDRSGGTFESISKVMGAHLGIASSMSSFFGEGGLLGKKESMEPLPPQSPETVEFPKSTTLPAAAAEDTSFRRIMRGNFTDMLRAKAKSQEES